MLQFARTLLLVAAVTLLAACSAVTRENFDKVETGMSLAQAQEILGAPTTKDLKSVGLGDVRLEGGTCTWESGGATITLTIVQGKVAAKSSEGL